jgi:diguanylate cyclase (GGDEF)-like protein
METATFDALAVDISLPDMSGLDVIAHARAKLPGCGIVAITGLVDVEIAIRSMKAGADDFLGKPFDAEMLWHVLGKACDSRRSQVEAEKAKLYRQLAYTDALTGCPNRRFIDELIESATTQAREHGVPLAVAYIDIDNFKLLNDFLGHDEGDQLLCKVANAIGSAVQPPAVFGRFGGDEFVAAFPGDSVAQAQAAMDCVRESVATFDVVTGAQMPLPTRVSVGLAVHTGCETPRELIAEAEERMYIDKSVTPALVAQALEGAAAHEGIKIANLKALRSLVKAIDWRDSYTRYHSDHATALAIATGRRIGLDVDQMNGIIIGGPIHDLGKIVVPDEILRKPGALSPDERRTMEEHPVMGAAITAAVTDYDTVVDLVRHHHERFDGRGYPGRLRGEQIRPATRLFTLADAFSAMTTDRPYRRGLLPERAIDEIQQGAGGQFDPDYTVEFIRMIEATRRTRGEAEAA